MSTIEPEDQEGTGYFLPEDSQLRLKQLRDYVGFLANLARPRQTDESAEWYAEIRPGEVAICLELLEEQIGQVLKALAWPAERGEDAPVAADAADTDDADTEEGADVASAEAGAEAADTAEPAAANRYFAGVTLDQIDEMNLRIGSLRALANVVTCADHAEFAKATLSIMGDAIYRDVDKLRDIVDDVYDSQQFAPRRKPRPGVQEEHASYLAWPTPLPSGSTATLVREHPTYQ